MARTKQLFALTTAGLATALATGYVLIGLWWGAPIALVGNLLWLWGNKRGWRWTSSAGLLFNLVMTAVGLLLSLAPGLAIASAVLSLGAWDISRLHQLLAKADRVHSEQRIHQRYRRRLFFVSIVGASVATLAMVIRLNIGFGVALLLGLTSVVGFSRAVVYLRRESD